MAHLIDILESFNRKERYFLLVQALGLQTEEGGAGFKLEASFRKLLKERLSCGKTRIDIPSNAYVAMDYHLNWIAAALALARGEENVRNELFEQSQEDIDFLIAFQESDGPYHLVFLEAKGFSSNPSELSTKAQLFSHFTKGQLESKVNRLNNILKAHADKRPRVIPHFCLMSGYKQRNFESLPSLVGTNEEQIRAALLKLEAPKTRRVVRFPEGGVRIDEVKLKAVNKEPSFD